ncbi:MAG: LysE family transporter [Candidatus Bathyarchaeia archaeon]
MISTVEALALIALGLAVGLSGAAIPGPLLAFTVVDTSKKGKVTGHYVMVGHVLWEAGVILLILYGLGWIFTRHSPVIYLVGGLVLAAMGVRMITLRRQGLQTGNPRTGSSIGGGLFYSAFNPTQPLWWATAGLALLLQGLEVMGLIGVALVTAGHWISDFGYYTFVSILVNRHKSYVNHRQREITTLLGLFLTLLGIFFVYQGVRKLDSAFTSI